MSDRSNLIQQYYQDLLETEAYYLADVDALRPQSRIASVRYAIDNINCAHAFDTVVIESLAEAVPDSIAEAFDRHLWFSQYSLTEVYLFNIVVEEKATYAICNVGMNSDGYDNSCQFIEIFNEAGEFVISAQLGEGEIGWLYRLIEGSDFAVAAPLWKNRDNVEIEKAWSENLAIAKKQQGNITRLRMC